MIDNTPNRVNVYAVERCTAYGTFPGAGPYSVCATNTGTANTTVTVRVRTDGEI